MALLRIDAQHLLIVADDARLGGCRPVDIDHQPIRRYATVLQGAAKMSRLSILADDAGEQCATSQADHVGGGVGGAAGAVSAAADFDDRHRSFGRDALDVTPEKLV